MAFVTGLELTKAIKRAVSSDSFDIAVAFWGQGACERLAMPADASGRRVACDARSGACNPSAIADLLKRNVEIVDVPGLHAKVYIGTKNFVVCSANASANGLGEEGAETSLELEAGYAISDKSDVAMAQAWFDNIFASGRKVTKRDLGELKLLWRRRQSDRPMRATGSFLQVLSFQPDLLLGRNLYATIVESSEVPQSVVQAYRKFTGTAAIARSDGENEYPYYWRATEWKIAAGDFILDFSVEKSAVSCSGIWRVQAVLGGGELIPVERTEKPFGLKLSSRDCNNLARRVQSLIKQREIAADGSLIYIRDFANLMTP